MPEMSDFEIQMAIEKLKRHKSPGTDQFPVEIIKAGGWKICCEIHKLINSILNKEELPEKRKELIIVPIYKKGDKTDCNIYKGFCQPCTKFFPTSCSQGLLHVQRKEIIGIVIVDFEATDELKGKGILRQAEVAQGVLGRLRPRIFSTLGTARVVGRQPNALAAFTPGEIPGTHFQKQFNY